MPMHLTRSSNAAISLWCMLIHGKRATKIMADSNTPHREKVLLFRFHRCFNVCPFSNSPRKGFKIETNSPNTLKSQFSWRKRFYLIEKVLRGTVGSPRQWQTREKEWRVIGLFPHVFLPYSIVSCSSRGFFVRSLAFFRGKSDWNEPKFMKRKGNWHE